MAKNLYDADGVLLTGIQRFYGEKKLFDVKVSRKDVVLFECHKIVLSSFSKYFETLLENTSGCAILSLDAVKESYVDQLNDIVKFMYGYGIVVQRRNCTPLLEAAKIFGVNALIKLLDAQNAGSTEQVVDDEENVVVKACAVGTLLVVNFQRYKEQSKFIDVEISCQSRVLFSCHKLVLAAFSFYFESLLIKTEGCAILNLDAVDALYVSQLDVLLNFMYGKIAKSSNVELLKDAAKVFGIYSMERFNNSFSTTRKKKRPTRKARVEVESIGHRCKTNADFSEANAAADSVQEEMENDGSVPSASASSIQMRCLRFPQPLSTHEPCKFCGKVLKLGAKSFQSHVQKHTLFYEEKEEESPSTSSQEFSKISCVDCGKLFSTINILKKHYQTHHTKEVEKNKVCLDCCLVFSNESDLDDHRFLKGCCGGKGDKHVSEESNSSAQQLSFEISSLDCEVCGQSFADRANLHNHLEHAHKISLFSCEFCSKSFKTYSGYKNHFDSHQSGSFSCPVCEYRATAKAYLNIHMIKYHDVTIGGQEKSSRFPCTECGQTFIYESLLRRHFESKHLRLKPFQCPYCEYACAEKAALQTHVRSVHTRVKLFACSFCGHKSTTASQLTRHRRTHTGEKPYACDQCEQRFPEKRDLNAHVAKVHDKVRPFECIECDVKFFRKDFLVKHMRTTHATVANKSSTSDDD